MKMKLKLFLILIAFPFFSQAEILEGIAKNQNGEIVYLEKHIIKTDASGLNLYIEVEYSKPDGKPFAKMISDFSDYKTIPQTTFEDFRFKTKSILKIKNSAVVFEEVKIDKTVSSKEVPFDESMVASQGFDNFIKLNLAKLESGPVEFRFGVLESKDFFSLTGYKRKSTGDESEYGIKASSWFLRLFASELRVTYDTKTKRLKSFSGRSNILNDAGKSQDVSITYTWRPEP